ncbi:MAG: hypothetical protein IPK26_23595 [Planctomycetes bacterium]|nr:hypothetical protein [Planctomycetota bacterium]
MSALQIVCDNCGAKYRLPETFAGDKAKCKQCGSVIDVAAQRGGATAAAAAPAAPAAARPAAARPAQERPARAESRSETRGERPARGKRGEDGDAKEGRGERRGRGEREEKKKSAMPLIAAAIAVAAIAVVAVVMFTRGDGDKKSTDTAQGNTPAASTPNPSNEPATGKPADAGKPAEATAPKGDARPADATTPAPTPEVKQPDPTPTPAAKIDDPKPAETPKADTPKATAPGDKWQNSKITTMDQVFDPKAGTTPIAWPAEVGEADQKKITDLLEDVRGGGKAAIAAKRELSAIGFHAIVGMANMLREIDYKNGDEAFIAWELNKLLEEMCEGLNVGFVTVDPGEDMDPRKADWNAKTAKAWNTQVARWQNEATFKDAMKARRQKKAEKDKGM